MKLTADLWTVAIKALDDVKGLPDKVVSDWEGMVRLSTTGKFP